jgi:hypothetical protein
MNVLALYTTVSGQVIIFRNLQLYLTATAAAIFHFLRIIIDLVA